MVQELNSIESLRNDFVTTVSHEFKTPLAAIEGYATLLQDPSLSEADRNEYTRIIIDSTRQLTTMSRATFFCFPSLAKAGDRDWPHEVHLGR